MAKSLIQAQSRDNPIKNSVWSVFSLIHVEEGLLVLIFLEGERHS